MATLDTFTENKSVKILCVADSGSGKTGGLASLVDAGYKMRILDLDDGISPLVGYTKKRENLKNVDSVVLRDKYKLMGTQRLGIQKAEAFTKCLSLLEGKDEWKEYGPVEAWDRDVVLVIDTLGTLGKACMNMVLAANNAGGSAPEIQHYGTAMDNIEKMIAMVAGKQVPCHLIINSHVDLREGTGGGLMKAYPDALGSKLNPKIGRYFDNLIGVSLKNGKRAYKTSKDGMLACKTAVRMPDELPIETGMAEIFEYLLGKKKFVQTAQTPAR